LNKYNASKTEADGHKFDSKLEAERYFYLLDYLRQGTIRELKVHPSFVFKVYGETVRHARQKNGRAGKELTYSADFSYYIGDGSMLHVEDVKGMITETFKIKWAFVKAFHPAHEFKVVRKKKGEWVKDII